MKPKGDKCFCPAGKFESAAATCTACKANSSPSTTVPGACVCDGIYKPAWAFANNA